MNEIRDILYDIEEDILVEVEFDGSDDDEIAIVEEANLLYKNYIQQHADLQEMIKKTGEKRKVRENEIKFYENQLNFSFNQIKIIYIKLKKIEDYSVSVIDTILELETILNVK